MKTVDLVHNGVMYTYIAGDMWSDPKIVADSIVTPIPEINPGNKKDPTAWKYTIDSKQRFLGKAHYKSDPTIGHIGAIYTGNGYIYEYVPWDRSRLYNRALGRLNDAAHERPDWSEDIFQFPHTKKLGNLVGLARDTLADAIKSGRDSSAPRKKGKLGRTGLGASKSHPSADGSLRSDSSSALAETSKLAATMQLQTAFAIKPLIGNIFDTANAMLQIATTTGIQLSGSAKEKIAVDKGVNNLDIYCSRKEVKHVERGVQGVRIKVYVNGLRGFNPLEWTTLNPLLLGWNLIPYSFIVDWFFDVGSYLENVENAFRNNGMFHSGYITYLYANYMTEEVRSASSDPQLVIDFARARRRLIFFEREVLNAWPLPRMPRLNVDLGSGQLLSAAALLRGMLK